VLNDAECGVVGFECGRVLELECWSCAVQGWSRMRGEIWGDNYGTRFGMRNLRGNYE